MALKHLLLGLLETPASGYDLGARFERTVGVFWSAELSQIYPTLHGLEREGFVRSEQRPPRDGPARRVYRRTARGEAALASWLRSDPEAHRPRISWLAQLFFLGQLEDLAELESYLRRMRGSFEKEASRLRAIAAADAAAEREAPGTPGPAGGRTAEASDLAARLVLEAGLAANAARLDWCEQSIGRVRAARARHAGTAEPDR